MNKKIIYLIGGVFAILLLIGLYWVNRTPKQMDVVRNGVYSYTNKGLGFALSLPIEFQYFQTQSKKGDGYTDIEIFIPTSDMAYKQEVSGYGKPLVVRVYDKDKYKAETDFQKKGEKEARVYALKFWTELPKDWREKWTEEINDNVLNSMTID